MLRAPLDRVWRADHDSQEFGQWFGVCIDGPFVAGTSVNATITGTTVDEEVAEMQALDAGAQATWQIVAVEPPRRFAYRWHFFAVDGGVDYGNEPATLVEFTLVGNGRRCAAQDRRVRIRRHPRVSPRRRVRSEQRRMGQARPRTRAASTSAWGSGATATSSRAALVLDALGDANRLRIVVRLCDGGPSSTSRHSGSAWPPDRRRRNTWSYSRRSWPVISSRRGRERIWTLQTGPLIDAGDFISNSASCRWDAAIGRLRTFVED